MKPLDAAKYILHLTRSEESGETISNLKMQKLLYFAQGLGYAYANRALFSEPVLAWQHGPVYRSVYNAFKKYGSNSIDYAELDDFDASKIDSDDASLLALTWLEYGNKGASWLVKKSHEQEPWRTTYGQTLDGVIPEEIIKITFCRERAACEEELNRAFDAACKELGIKW